MLPFCGNGYYQPYTPIIKPNKLLDSIEELKRSGVIRGIELATLLSNFIRFKPRTRRFPITQYKTEKVLYQYGRRLNKRLLELVDFDVAAELISEFDDLPDSEKIECVEYLKRCNFISDEEFHAGTF